MKNLKHKNMKIWYSFLPTFINTALLIWPNLPKNHFNNWKHSNTCVIWYFGMMDQLIPAMDIYWLWKRHYTMMQFLWLMKNTFNWRHLHPNSFYNWKTIFIHINTTSFYWATADIQWRTFDRYFKFQGIPDHKRRYHNIWFAWTFNHDHPATQYEAGQQKGGNYASHICSIDSNCHKNKGTLSNGNICHSKNESQKYCILFHPKTD